MTHYYIEDAFDPYFRMRINHEAQGQLRMQASAQVRAGGFTGNGASPTEAPAPSPSPAANVPSVPLATAIAALFHGENIPLWVIGGGLYVCGSFGISLGLNLQKFATGEQRDSSTDDDTVREHLIDEDSDAVARTILLDEDANAVEGPPTSTSASARLLWLLGFISYLLSGVLLSLALAFAPQAGKSDHLSLKFES